MKNLSENLTIACQGINQVATRINPMPFFFVALHPLRAVELIDDLIENEITVQQRVSLDSIIIRPYPEQIPILEQICRNHATDLLEGFPPEWTEAMIRNGAVVTVLKAREQAAALRREWRDRAAIALQSAS